jgi:hypothetical protein
MVSSRAETVDAYLAELPEERRAAIAAVRKVIRKHLPRGFEETMQYGMISYVVPLARSGPTYNGQPLAVAALASQKNHMAVYLTGIYGSTHRAEFEAAYAKSGKRLDAGQSCVRFKRLDDLALDAVAGAIARVSVDDMIALTAAAHGGKAAAAKTKPKATPVAKKKAASTTSKRSAPARSASPGRRSR